MQSESSSDTISYYRLRLEAIAESIASSAERLTEWEMGQLDGVRWALDVLKEKPYQPSEDD